MRRISLETYFATLHYVPIVFNLIRSVVFLAFRSIDMICECRMSPFPTIFTLRDARIHVGISYCGDVAINVEASVN